MLRPSYEARYRYGKLYNTETGKRILIAEEAKVVVIVRVEDILEKDPLNYFIEPPTREKIEKELEGKKSAKKLFRYKLIAERGSFLQFQIKAGKANKKGRYSIEKVFYVQLLSELYMIQKNEANEYGLVYDVTCKVASVEGDLPSFEPIYAYSLNDAYMKTYDFYFALFGKPTTNIYNNYFLVKKDRNVPLFEKRMWRPLNDPYIINEDGTVIGNVSEKVNDFPPTISIEFLSDQLRVRITNHIYNRYLHIITGNKFIIGKSTFAVDDLIESSIQQCISHPEQEIGFIVTSEVKRFSASGAISPTFYI